MQPDHLTYQWLTPVMMAIIAFLVGIIGFMIKGYLASITERFEILDDKITKHMDKVEKSLNDEKENYFALSGRVSTLEGHAGIK